MQQPYTADNWLDDNGNPAGGEAHATGIDITWQNGPLGRGDTRTEPNGAFVETVLHIVRDRIEFYQGTKFNCRENALAITKIEEAIHWLQSRTARREKQNVEGTHAGN